MTAKNITVPLGYGVVDKKYPKLHLMDKILLVKNVNVKQHIDVHFNRIRL